MTRYVCAPDSFKESLTSTQAAAAMRRGILAADPSAEIRCIPVADGGEGTTEALVEATHGSFRTASTHDPLGRPITAQFGLLGDRATAVIETAAASGLALLAPAERNPLVASSRGTGELIVAALDAGATSIIIGLGGSATNDAGAGLMSALGARFLDGSGNPIGPGGAALASIASIDMSGLDPRLAHTAIAAACDVQSPLVGPRGASATYGPQKGASVADVAVLDSALRHFADVVRDAVNVDVRETPGAGAAGGIGAALLALLGAEFVPGIDVVIAQTGLERAVEWADIVFTGEGAVDGQTGNGKAPQGIAALAKRHRKPVILFAGRVGLGVNVLHDSGVDAVFSIAPGPAALEDLVADAEINLVRTAEQVVRVLGAARRL